jgi:hypothetical protein
MDITQPHLVCGAGNLLLGPPTVDPYGWYCLRLQYKTTVDYSLLVGCYSAWLVLDSLNTFLTGAQLIGIILGPVEWQQGEND